MRQTVTGRIKSVFGGRKSQAPVDVEEADDDFGAGDILECIGQLTVRTQESTESDVLVMLKGGDAMEVVQFGVLERRCQILTYQGKAGWISARTKFDEKLVRKSKVATISVESLETFTVGTGLEVLCSSDVLAREDLDSPVSMNMPANSACKVVQTSKNDLSRMKVDYQGIQGWITVVTQSGESLITRTNDVVKSDGARSEELRSLNSNGGYPAAPTSPTSPTSPSSVSKGSTSLVTPWLDAAKTGDVQALKDIMATPVLFAGQQSKGPNPNSTSSSHGGKSALMFAAAFGKQDVVEMLLELPELMVNMCDDRGLSALHHIASKEESALVEASVRVAICQLLLAKDADPTITDGEGRRPFDCASSSGYSELESMLRQGAGEDAKGADAGESPSSSPSAKAKTKRKSVAKKKVSSEGKASAEGTAASDEASAEATAAVEGEAEAPKAKKKVVKKSKSASSTAPLPDPPE